jgi:hypothetical protein
MCIARAIHFKLIVVSILGRRTGSAFTSCPFSVTLHQIDKTTPPGVT